MVGPQILTVLVNYRTPALTLDALQSLAPQLGGKAERRVIIVDNGSDDVSAGMIAAAISEAGFGGWCDLLALPDNRGFAAGNNAAVRQAAAQGFRPDLIWLLNPDTLVLPDALDALVRFLGAHPDVGIVGGRCETRDGQPLRCAFRFPSPLGEIEGVLGIAAITRLLGRHVLAPAPVDRATPVDWVSGASMMVRQPVFERLGGFDEGYFLYFEETDFCRRAADLGIGCWHEPASRIVHLVGRSSGVTDRRRGMARRPRYWFESRSRYYRRHLGRAALVAATAGWLLAFPLGRLLGRLRGRAGAEAPMLWRDMLCFGYGSARDRAGAPPDRH